MDLVGALTENGWEEIGQRGDARTLKKELHIYTVAYREELPANVASMLIRCLHHSPDADIQFFAQRRSKLRNWRLKMAFLSAALGTLVAASGYKVFLTFGIDTIAAKMLTLLSGALMVLICYLLSSGIVIAPLFRRKQKILLRRYLAQVNQQGRNGKLS